jgi:hypothetical protein
MEEALRPSLGRSLRKLLNQSKRKTTYLQGVDHPVYSAEDLSRVKLRMTVYSLTELTLDTVTHQS